MLVGFVCVPRSVISFLNDTTISFDIMDFFAWRRPAQANQPDDQAGD